MLVQTSIVLAVVSDPNNPITAAITSAIGNLNPTPAPTATPSPSATPSPAPTPQPTAVPTATPSATPTSSPAATATPSAQPISSPITDNPPNCLNFWIFSICLPDFISPPISTPIVIPSPTPIPTPTPIATPAPTPNPVVTPAINTIFPNPATQGTQVRLTGSGFGYFSKLYIGGDLPAPDSFYSVSEDGKSLTFVLTTEFDYRAGQILPIVVQNGSIRSNSVDLTVAPSIVDPLPLVKANQKLITPSLKLDEEHPQAVIISTNFNTDITIPASVSKATLKFSNTSTIQNKVAAFFNNIININAETEAGTIKVQIPSLTTIFGPLNWNGIINAPQVKDNTTAKPSADQGKIAIVSKVIEVGADDTPLTFEKGVRLLIPKQAGKLAGYQRGSEFSKITNNCSADSQTAADNLPAQGDCYISVGNDLVIWTKHFTKFVTYTQTANQSSNASSGSNSNPQAPVCTNTKPQSAPKLISAKVTGRNQVSLTWSKALDPVTYYLVTYGSKPGVAEYGNPNIGGKDTTSYVVKGLNHGQTYYFKVRAGNNCTPGDFSNELAVKASGDNLQDPARGFKAGVLSTNKASNEATPKFEPITQAQPQRAVAEAGNIFTRLISFLGHFFQK